MEVMSKAVTSVKTTAMIFEHSKEWAYFAQTIMNREGMSVLEWVRTGTEWITPWRRSKPYIVVMDLLLPKRDGLHCMEKMLSLKDDIRVIFTHSFTGAMANAVEVKALSMGALCVLQKPYTDKRFSLALKRAREYQKPKKLMGVAG